MNSKETLEKYAYAVADKQAELIDQYCRMYIKKKPKYIPEFVYRFVLGKFIVIAYFNK